MKLSKSSNEINQNFKAVKSYDMKLSDTASAHIIQSLINLYSNPLAAVIRELSANARDSHIEAGKSDVPIRVSTPNKFGNDELIIMDEGIGIDESGLERYVTIGDSTKGNTNDQVGAFGLGCKSPLSLVSQFTVIATKDGITRHAIVGEQENNRLGIDIISVRQTDQPNGVTIKIPMRSENVHNAVNEAREFFKFWTPGTVLLNGEKPKHFLDNLEKHQYVKTEDGVVYGTTNYYNRVTTHVVMGNVAYPVDMSQIHEENNFALRDMGIKHTANMVIYADIGSLDLVPSRDSLKYSSKTSKTIASLVKKVRDDAAHTLHDKVRNALSYAAAEKQILKSRSLIIPSEISQLVDGLDDFSMYNDHKYDRSIASIMNETNGTYDEQYDKMVQSTEYADARDSDKRRMETNLFQQVKHTWKAAIAEIQGYGTLKIDPHAVIFSYRSHATEAINSLVFYDNHLNITLNKPDSNSNVEKSLILHFDMGIEDTKNFKITSHRAKIKLWMNHNNYKKVYIVVGKIAYNPWIHENDNITFVDGSDFFDEVIEIKKEMKKNNVSIPLSRNRSETEYDVVSSDSRHYEKATISSREEEIVVCVEGDIHEIPFYRSLAPFLEKNDAVLVAVNKSRSLNALQKRVDENGKTLMSIKTFVESIVPEIQANDEVMEAIENRILNGIISQSNALSFFASDFWYEKDKYKDLMIDGHNAYSIFDSVLKATHGVSFDHESDENKLWVVFRTGERIDPTIQGLLYKKREELSESFNIESINNKYPMLDQLKCYDLDKNIVIDYIKMINNQTK